jgi:hypothetical protein
MPEEPSRASPDRPRKRRRRLGRRLVLVALLLALVAGGTLVTSGWPLHPLLPLANRTLGDTGPRLTGASLWLRVTFEGELRLEGARLLAEDPLHPGAVELSGLHAVWPLGRLLRGDPASARIEVERLVLRPRCSPEGLWSILEIAAPAPPSEPANAAPTETPTLAWERLCADPAHPLRLVCRELRVEFPETRPFAAAVLRLSPRFELRAAGEGWLDLAADLGPVRLDGTELVVAESRGHLHPRRAEIEWNASLRLPDTAPLAAFLPPESPPLPGFDLTGELVLRAGWAPLALPEFSLRLASRGGSLALDGRSRPLPRWVIEGKAEARDFEPLPTATLRIESTLWAEGDEAPPVESRLEVSLEAATGLARLQARTHGWTLIPLRDWVEGLATLEADARFGGEFEATVDLGSRRLRGATATLVLDQGSLSMPEWLRQPVAIAPTRCALRLEADLAAGNVEAFTLRAGPIVLESPGFNWTTGATGLGGNGRLTLRLPPGGALADWLQPEAMARLPLSPEELAELSLGPVRISLTADGQSPRDATLALRAEGEILLNETALPWTAGASLASASGAWRGHLDLPAFQPSQWRLRLFARWPLPDLELPMSLHLEGAGTLASGFEDAGWEFRAGPGTIGPQGALAEWLEGALPVESFVLGGRLREGGRKALLDRCELHSGRARMRFDRFEVALPASVLEAAPAAARLELGLLLEHWFPEDFLPLFTPRWRASVPLSAEELANCGLERLELRAAAELALDPDGTWSPRTLSAHVATRLRGDTATVPISTDLGYDPATRVFTAKATSSAIESEIWQLKAFSRLPLPLDGIAVPLRFTVELSAGLPGATPAPAPPPRLGLSLFAGPGTVALPGLLRAPLDLRALECALRLRLDTLELEEASARLDLGGLGAVVEEARAIPEAEGAAWRSQVALRLDHLDLGWLFNHLEPALWEAHLPPALAPAAFSGGVSARLRLETRLDPGVAALPAFDALDYGLRIADLRIAWKDRPPVELALLEIAGDADRATLDLTRLHTRGWALPSLAAIVNGPLGPRPALELDLRLLGELDTLRDLYAPWAAPLALPENPFPAALSGSLEAHLRASAPIHPLPAPSEVAAELTLDLRALPLAALPVEPVFAGEADLRARLALVHATAEGEGVLALRSLAWEPIVAGDTAFTWQLATVGPRLEARVRGDLRDLALSDPAGRWSKPPGTPAAVALSAGLPTGWPAQGPRTVEWGFDAEGCLFEHFAAEGSAVLDPGPDAPWGGLQNATLDHLRFDAGELAGALTLGADGLSLEAEIRRFDVPVLLRRLAGILGAASPEGAPEAPPADVVASAEASPAPTLPPVRLSLRGGGIHLGEGRFVEDLAFSASLDLPRPPSARLSFRVGGSPSELVLAPAQGAAPQDWHLVLGDLGALFDGFTAPVRAAPAAFPPDSPLPPLAARIGMLAGGHLRLGGTVRLDPADPVLDASLELTGLVFQQDVPLLRRLAALAKRDFVLRVPCHRFTFANLHYEADHFTAREGFIDGPIDLGIEAVTLDFADGLANAKGKVFGLCFEVDGPLADPSLYLCEENRVIRALTQEDEFVW